MSAELEVIWWRDIPAQVLARSGRTVHRTGLSERFQFAIDAAAMRAGLAGTDDYLSEWRKVRTPCGENLEEEAQAEAQRLERAFSEEALAGYVRNLGRAP